MAIRYSSEDNRRIAKIVQSYNKKVRRANVEGKIRKSDLPALASVKELKRSYQRRADLERELKNLQKFTRKSARLSAEDKVSGAVTEYDVSLIKSNKRATLKYLQRRADIIRAKAESNYPLQKERLNAIEKNIEILSMSTSKASPSQLKAMARSVENYRQSFERQATGYRGFLSEVDKIMTQLDIPKSDRDALFNKLSKLNEEEFNELYERNDLIDRIYQLADSPKNKNEDLILNASDEYAKELVTTLMEEIDGMVAQVKNK